MTPMTSKVFPLVPSAWLNVICGLSVTVLLYSNVMRIITGSSNEMQVAAWESAVAEDHAVHLVCDVS